MCSNVSYLSLSRSSKIWIYTSRRVRLAEDLRVPMRTDFRTLSIVRESR